MSSGAAAVIGFHHVGVVVPDLQQAIAFYRELLGFAVISESAWDTDNATFNHIVGLKGSAARFCMLRGENSYIELFEYSEPRIERNHSADLAFQPGYRHLSFAVVDVTAALERCIELGGAKMNDPLTVTGRARGVYCHDPFGNLLEFIQPMGDFPQPFLFK